MRDKLRAVLFDLDDTLYDQQAIFEKAVKDCFKKCDHLKADDMFTAFRKYSDETFEQSEAGIISVHEMQMRRIEMTLKSFGIEIARSEADDFQRYYTECEHDAKLTDTMTEILQKCSAKVKTGIISNGIIKRQTDKINALGLNRFIVPENVFISDAVGYKKPDREVFLKSCEALRLLPQECCYVGDSLINDVYGALNASLKVIWLNRRNVSADLPDCDSVTVVGSESELKDVLFRLI